MTADFARIAFFLSLLIFAGVWGFFKIRAVWKSATGQSGPDIESETVKQFEDYRNAARHEAEKRPLAEKINEARRWFPVIIFAFLALSFSGCGSKTLLVFPEPPAVPKIDFQEKSGGAWMAPSDLDRLTVYMAESAEYRKRLIDFLSRLGEKTAW